MIVFDQVSYTYPGHTTPALHNVALEVAGGAFAVVAGGSGSGKSTLLRCINGLVPHFTGGQIAGSVRVLGLDPVAESPQGMSRHVGFVFQDPESQFVLDRVEDEIAFALENAALPPQEMRVRVEETLDLLGLEPLRDRSLATLSGGEKQRVAIAAALALRPQILVLDEPTSQLDPRSAEDVLNALVRLNDDLGLTIVLAEHRLERVLGYADRLIYLNGDGTVLCDEPGRVLEAVEAGPPVVQLGRRLGWSPLPMTVKDGLRFSRAAAQGLRPVARAGSGAQKPAGAPFFSLQNVEFAYGKQMVLRKVALEVRQGEIVALMGRNGAGKSTLLKSLVGLVKPAHGSVRVGDVDALTTDTATICRSVAYLPQDPNALLFADTVADELRITLRNHGYSTEDEATRDQMRRTLARLGLATMAEAYPRDLSVGERQRVALGAVTVTEPGALLLDEPTRGLDIEAKKTLAATLRDWKSTGAAIVIVTHDVEFAVLLADRVVLMSQGEIIADGAPAEVLGGSPLFAPQVARLFPNTGWLTEEDALAGLAQADA